ncbi:ABC transporter ATP-binding protein [Arthrobacter agilis]|uniref:ABC transporter ATP-binding protein n=1 Tax=Arthrobacter agilis TaxID=37921 RepID=UPI000B360297|nr:ABC transporter ATP-binding protein [Arthrobacter agilis]OUM41418.1 polyamine ABC transporter ATP-binding protein [Arthrobacter agilis]PPB46250.1 ABC transporter ATP-binding protein [Arthrobacter agilis]TPV27006.1 ABC transporter ATP-binding protein [Arthrobacter agilis]VDR32851.1 Spermidine/putrescine import ATP-binding protein PotA [Arthrobacter agilis]
MATTTSTSTSTSSGTTAQAGPSGSLHLDNLVKQYPGGASTEPAVAGIDLDIRPGEFLTLLGPSGCGKTTTLRMIAGFETPSHGSLTLDGEDMVALTPDKRPMAMVFQSYALFPHMSVFDNVAYGLRLQKLPKKRVQEEVDFALASMSLTKLADRAPNQLSGGQQQRVALARAMVMKPKVLLFDEPLSNLDAKLRVQMRTEIRALQHKLGITSVYVTHDQDEAMSLSDRIVVMRQGRIEQVATPEIVYRKPASVFVADFIGRANFLDTSIGHLTLHADGARATVRALGTNYTVPAHDGIDASSQVCLMVRPESVVLAPAPDAREVSGDEGRVLKSVFYGAWVEYEIETVDGNVTAVIYDPAPGDILDHGTFVRVSFEQDRAWLLPAED